jgi:hypothetical protein
LSAKAGNPVRTVSRVPSDKVSAPSTARARLAEYQGQDRRLNPLTKCGRRLWTIQTTFTEGGRARIFRRRSIISRVASKAFRASEKTFSGQWIIRTSRPSRRMLRLSGKSTTRTPCSSSASMSIFWNRLCAASRPGQLPTIMRGAARAPSSVGIGPPSPAPVRTPRDRPWRGTFGWFREGPRRTHSPRPYPPPS